jgi:hypothetical protein
MSQEYIKQLEEANQNLQAKLETQADDMDRLSAAFAQTRHKMRYSRLVAVCGSESDIYGDKNSLRDLVYSVSLIVIPVSFEEKLKVYEKYQISSDVRLSLFKSIKDRNHKQGSIYDIDLLNKYSKGEDVKPYEI